jgi:hypothetical protein
MSCKERKVIGTGKENNLPGVFARSAQGQSESSMLVGV